MGKEPPSRKQTRDRKESPRADLENGKALLPLSELEWHTLFDAVADSIALIDLNGRILLCNKATSDILARPIDQIVGHICWNLFHGTSEPIEGCPLVRMRETHRPESLEVSIRDRVFSVSIHPVFDQDGDVYKGVQIVSDISDQKEAEKKKDRLEAKIQKTQRMEAIGTLAGGIAHKFNNILASILGNASLAILDSDETHPNYQRLQDIMETAKKGAQLTGQLLGYARSGTYDVKPIDLNRLVKKMSETFGETRKDISIHLELAEDLHMVEADQGQIEQVLLNLYVNSAEAMPRGGDLFLRTMNATDKNIEGGPYDPAPGDYALLTIKDTGVGMSKETVERIFDPFYTTKGLAQSSGLGLASVYGVVKGHRGYIEVDSKEGAGSTFSIYLPATQRSVTDKKKRSTDELISGEETILLVDDEEMVLHSSARMLRKLGYEVLLAGSGHEALALYRKHQDRIDMVLLDIVMPGMGGGETYDRMRKINPKVKVLLSSGYDIDGEVKAILNRGCDGFVQKPFLLGQLSQEIRKILDKD